MSAHNEPAQAAPDELDAAIARIQADMCANECPCCADGRTLISALARLRAELAAARADLRAEEKGQDNLRRCLASAEAERDALRADAERWQTLCNLWMACTILTLTQDEDGRWSIEATEPVDYETFATLTGDDPDAAIDAARSA